ncbi:RNA 2'-phosphotransferase [Sporocytophaga myxococcoides]|uniref:Probable RNA 2'-phosphotransferase n=1 Tax=Sporocytophaga myxococcoides TaxID=153721 RepID=A0A098LIR8_9BACT|nr:RNA 2'-phosphotransferase [Sporocytophaga myxococcoides]GAL86272.1 RNA 2'-phosphotransferase [Sporocytophaga myxococcoides]
MISEKENQRISKFLSLVLRHKPETIGINLDRNGWVDTQLLIFKINQHGFNISMEILDYVVDTNNKKRFAFNENKTLIRASQGHSVKIELGYEPQKPPEILYHGSAECFSELILKTGLIKQSRQHVHLSVDVTTAISVGKRHGKPVIFEVVSGEMFAEGFVFYLSENKVWLTEHVPVRYLKQGLMVL